MVNNIMGRAEETENNVGIWFIEFIIFIDFYHWSLHDNRESHGAYFIDIITKILR